MGRASCTGTRAGSAGWPVTTGYDGRGKRVVRKAAGRTKTEAKGKLRELLRDRDEGMTESNCTVRQAVED